MRKRWQRQLALAKSMYMDPLKSLTLDLKALFGRYGYLLMHRVTAFFGK